MNVLRSLLRTASLLSIICSLFKLQLLQPHFPHHWNVEATDMMLTSFVQQMNNNKWKPCRSNTAKTYKSVRSLRYCWNVYMRELSFLGSFPQTSAHIRAGGKPKPAAWNAHTHMHTKISTGTFLSTTILLAQSTTTPSNVCLALHFYFPLTLFHAFAHNQGPPAVQFKHYC